MEDRCTARIKQKDSLAVPISAVRVSPGFGRWMRGPMQDMLRTADDQTLQASIDLTAHEQAIAY